MDTQSQEETKQTARWRLGKQHVQAAALVAILGSSFALYVALAADLTMLAAACFALITLAMASTIAAS